MTGAEILEAIEENRKHEERVVLIVRELHQQQAYLRSLKPAEPRHAVGS